jgi:TRAP-type mannitol/chloroaromatic compound transport system permease small subunit
MQESVIYLHATLFMLAIGYTYLVDQHVRVDVLYAGWSPRRKALVDLLSASSSRAALLRAGVWASWGFVARVLDPGRGPDGLGGLPLVPALKSLIPLMAVLLGLQAVSIAIRCVAVLTGAAETHFPHRAHQGSA